MRLRRFGLLPVVELLQSVVRAQVVALDLQRIELLLRGSQLRGRDARPGGLRDRLAAEADRGARQPGLGEGVRARTRARDAELTDLVADACIAVADLHGPEFRSARDVAAGPAAAADARATLQHQRIDAGILQQARGVET